MVSIEEIHFYQSIIHQLNVVFDVGCQHDNIFSDLKPGIEAHLFDPVESYRLMDSINCNRKITYNNFALGDFLGACTFHPAYGSILYREDLNGEDEDHSEIVIPIDTLANYCQEKNITKIDYLKIDTEGFDFKVIKGCGEMLHHIKFIQFEDWTKEMVKSIIDYLPHHNLTTINSKPKNFVAHLINNL